MDSPITPEEYVVIQGQLLLLARFVQTWNLDGFLAAINMADTLGPILDPTLYMRGRKNMGFIEDLARAAATFQALVAEACRRHDVGLPVPAAEGTVESTTSSRR